MRARALGYDVGQPHHVLVLRGQAPNSNLLFHAVQRVARDLAAGALVASIDDAIVVLSPDHRAWEALRARVESAVGSPCRLGVGGRADEPAEIPRSYREATIALRLQVAVGGGHQTTEYERLGIYRLLAGIEDLDAIDRFVVSWLGPLMDYDNRRRGDLVATLDTFLETGRHLGQAAAELHVHRSTLKYRLGRIEEISGHDLDDSDVAFNLQLASRARRVVAAMRESDLPY
jgi:DNA-binding PucR family transcriptional regulator